MSALKNEVSVSSFDEVLSNFGSAIAGHLNGDQNDTGCIGLYADELRAYVLIGLRENAEAEINEVLILRVPTKLFSRVDPTDEPCGVSTLLMLDDNGSLPEDSRIQTVVADVRKQLHEREKLKAVAEAALQVLEEETPELRRIMERILEVVGVDPDTVEIQIGGGESIFGHELTIRAVDKSFMEEVIEQMIPEAARTELQVPDWLTERYTRPQ